MSTDIPISLEDYFNSTPIGSLKRAVGNNLYGINHRKITSMVPSNRDRFGYTFFTRPQLNLQSDNIRNYRLMYPLMSSQSTSIGRFVRSTLDPRMTVGYNAGNGAKQQPITCPLVDSAQAFIPVLSNNLNSLSGWPDLTAPIFTTKGGLYNESWGQVDGIVRYFESFDLDANFRNTVGDPIAYMMFIWLNYMSLVFEGRLVPYPDFIANNELDYNTRIYRFVLNSTGNRVVKAACVGAAFPTSAPTGSFLDMDSNQPLFALRNKDISVRFRCFGMDIYDDIVIKEFNETVCIFNPDMRDGVRDEVMVRVPDELKNLFNLRGYFRINPITYDFEIYVARDMFLNRTRQFLDESTINDYLDQDNYYQGD